MAGCPVVAAAAAAGWCGGRAADAAPRAAALPRCEPDSDLHLPLALPPIPPRAERILYAADAAEAKDVMAEASALYGAEGEGGAAEEEPTEHAEHAPEAALLEAQ